MDQEQRFRTLERDLGRLEGIVESLLASQRLEHEALKQMRQETQQELREMGSRMEKAVSDLAGEIKKLAREDASRHVVLDRRTAMAEGGWNLSRLLFGTALSIAMLLTSWVGSRAGSGGLGADRPPAERR